MAMLNYQIVYPPSINLSDLSLVRSMVGFLVAYPGYPDSSLDDLGGTSISAKLHIHLINIRNHQAYNMGLCHDIYIYIHNLRYRMLYLHQTNSGWWFGTWILWLSQWISSSQLTNSIIFQRARAKNHQPVKVFTKLQTNLQLSYATRVTASSEHRQVLGAMLSYTLVGFVTNVVI